MTYDEVKDKLIQHMAEKKSKEREITSLNDRILSIQTDIRKSIENERDELENAKKRELSRREEEISKPLNKKLKQLSDKVADKKAMYEKKVKEIEKDVKKGLYKDEIPSIEELEQSIALAKEEIKTFMSPRFEQELFDQWESKRVDVELSQLVGMTHKYKGLIRKSRLLHKAGKLDLLSLIDSLLKAINPTHHIKENDETEDIRNRTLLYIGVCGILSFVVMYFVSPYLLLLVVAVGAMNIAKSNYEYQLAWNTKLIEDNLHRIEDEVEVKEQEEIEKEKKRLKGFLDEVLTEIADEEATIQEEMNRSVGHLRSTFVFDDAKFKRDYGNTRKILESQIQGLKDNIEEIKYSNNNLDVIIKELENQLSEMVNDIERQYIRYEENPGTDLIFSNKFLIDVDKTRNVPLFWSHPKKPCIFIYDEREEVIQFVKLITLQLFVRFSPFSFQVNMIDTERMASEFSEYIRPDSKIVTAITEGPAVTDYIKGLDSELKRRNKKMLSPNNEIDKYNKFMIDNESVTENYSFNFLIGYKDGLLETEEMQRLLNIGSQFGLFTHILMSQDMLFTMKDKLEDLFKVVENIYYVDDGDIKPQSPNKILNMFNEG